MSKLESWAEYLAVQLTLAQIDEEYWQLKINEKTALLQIENKAAKTATLLKAAPWEDADYTEIQQQYHKAYRYRKLVEALYANMDRRLSLTSRELTRRVGRDSRERRGTRER